MGVTYKDLLFWLAMKPASLSVFLGQNHNWSGLSLIVLYKVGRTGFV